MKKVIIIHTMVFAFFLCSCAFAPDMDWVPKVEIEKKFTGIKKEYHDNKKVMSITHYKMDLRHGKYTTYYSNGQKNKEVNYIYDKAQGPFTWHYESGELYKKGTYNNNKINGMVTQYDKTGKITKESYYYNGSELNDMY